MQTKSDMSDVEAIWERRLERPWRPPAREIAVADPLLADLADGRPIAAITLSRLQGGQRFESPSSIDPVGPQPSDPAALLVDQERARVRAEMCRGVRDLVSCLDAREIEVVRLRFGLDGEDALGPRAIADRLGLSRKGVYNIQRRALAKLSAEKRARELLEVCDELAA